MNHWKRNVVEPYTMIATSEHYYLVCRTDGHSETNHYRIDLMRDIIITDVPVLRNEAWRKASENAVYAFSGEPERIKLRCCNYIVGDVIDRFGASVQIIPDGDSHFFASFTAAPFAFNSGHCSICHTLSCWSLNGCEMQLFAAFNQIRMSALLKIFHLKRKGRFNQDQPLSLYNEYAIYQSLALNMACKRYQVRINIWVPNINSCRGIVFASAALV